MNNNEVRVSVCLACYNGEKFIADQINSILNQLGADDELIISDDNSSDSTVDIIKSINDDRIHLISNELRKGVNGNFENALRNSKGKYIFLSDQDDVWMPGKVDNVVKALQSHTCIVHDAYITDGDLNMTRESFFEAFRCREGVIHNWIKNGYLGCAMAFRREILSIALPIPENLPVWHDIWIGTLCAIHYDLAFVPFKGIKFRRQQSTTSGTAKKGLPLYRKLSCRLGLLRHVFARLVCKK